MADDVRSLEKRYEEARKRLEEYGQTGLLACYGTLSEEGRKRLLADIEEIDLPMMKTYINAFGSTREYIHALVEKLTGKSEFRGRSSDLVFCGRWDTRL